MSSRYQKAFVLLKVEPGHEEEVVDDLLKLAEVREVHIVPGEWDLLAVIQAEKEIVAPGDEKVYKLVMGKIGKIKHVRDTNTMVSHFSKSK
jgi:DNA-binding Lrp family transcriptional regulator